MRVSVIIPTYNRKYILLKVLEEFSKQEKVDDNFEIVIVDDGSTDKTPELFNVLNSIDSLNAKISERYNQIIEEHRTGRLDQIINFDNYTVRPDLKYIRIKKSGRSVARNVGLQISTGDLTIFSDDDIFVEKYYIHKHINAHYPDDKIVVMGKVINTTSLDNPFSARWKLQDINTAFLATGNASVLKRYIEEAGGFDENYRIYGWEDFDLGVHLREIGLKSVKKPIYGYHYNPILDDVDPEALYNKERERGITAVYFYINHPLPWVKRFTLIENKFLPFLVDFFAKKMLDKCKRGEKVKLRGLKRLLFRYRAYFDGVKEGKRMYE